MNVLIELGIAIGGFALGYLILREVREIRMFLSNRNGETKR